jgi:hypothetical protein
MTVERGKVLKISTKPQACSGLLIVEQPLTSLRQMQTKCLHSLSGHRNRVVRQSIMNNHLLEVLNGKIMYENFNLGKPPPTPPPSLPHMPAIAGAYPLVREPANQTGYVSLEICPPTPPPPSSPANQTGQIDCANVACYTKNGKCTQGSQTYNLKNTAAGDG